MERTIVIHLKAYQAELQWVSQKRTELLRVQPVLEPISLVLLLIYAHVFWVLVSLFLLSLALDHELKYESHRWQWCRP